MLSVLQTLILTVAIVVLSHEADAFISDMFEETTGTEMRVASIAQRMQEDDGAEEKPVSVLPAYTKKTKAMRTRNNIRSAYNTVVDFGGGRSASMSVPVRIASPARL